MLSIQVGWFQHALPEKPAHLAEVADLVADTCRNIIVILRIRICMYIHKYKILHKYRSYMCILYIYIYIHLYTSIYTYIHSYIHYITLHYIT